MASLDLARIRQAVADQVQETSGIRAYALVPDAPELPCVVVDPGEPYIALNESFSGTAGTKCTVNLTVNVYVSAASGWRDAQSQLDRLLSTGLSPDRSVYGALEADRTLGGVVQSLVCQQVTGLGRDMVQVDAGVQAYTAAVDVEIHTYR